MGGGVNLKNKISLISGAFVVVLLAVLFFTFWYLFPAMKKTSKELAITEQGLSLTSSKQSKQIRDTYEKMKPDYQKIENLFANPTTPLDLIGFWEKITGEENLIMKITPIVVEKYKYDPWKFLGFEITLSGHFINIQKFIQKIENSKYLFEINSLIIKKNPASKKLDQTDEATATILLKTYTN